MAEVTIIGSSVPTVEANNQSVTTNNNSTTIVDKITPEELQFERDQLENWFQQESQQLLITQNLINNNFAQKNQQQSTILTQLVEGRITPLKIVTKQLLCVLQPDILEHTEDAVKTLSNQIIAAAERRNYSVVNKQSDVNRFEDMSEGQFWVWEVRNFQQLKEWKGVAGTKRKQRKEAKKRIYAIINCQKYGNGKKSQQHWQRLQESKSFKEIMEMVSMEEHKENLQISSIEIPELILKMENPQTEGEAAMQIDETVVNPVIQTPKKQIVVQQSPKKNNTTTKNKDNNRVKTMSIANFFKKKVCIASGGSKSAEKKSPQINQNNQLIVEQPIQSENQQILMVSFEDLDTLKSNWLKNLKSSKKFNKQQRGLPPPFSRSQSAIQSEQELADLIHGSGCNACTFPTYRRKLFWHPAYSDQIQFYGSCKFSTSETVSARTPFLKDDRIDYDADDEEEDEEGEILEGDDEEDDLQQEDAEIDAENDGLIVPDGYFSEDEKQTMSFPDENSTENNNYNNNNINFESSAIRNLTQKINRAKQQKKVVVVSSIFKVEGNQNGTVFLNDEEILKEFKMVALDENARVVKPQAIEDFPVFVQQNSSKKRKIEDPYSGLQQSQIINTNKQVGEKTSSSSKNIMQFLQL